MASSEDNVSRSEVSSGADPDNAQVRRLISDIEQDLAGMPEDVPGVDKLRYDLESLKQALAASADPGDAGGEQAHTIRERLQNLTASMEGEVLKDSPYIAEIGRILGMV